MAQYLTRPRQKHIFPVVKVILFIVQLYGDGYSFLYSFSRLREWNNYARERFTENKCESNNIIIIVIKQLCSAKNESVQAETRID